MLSKIEASCFIIWCTMTAFTVGVACYAGWMMAVKEGVRQHVLQSVQDGDGVTHQSDGKFVVLLILGLFSAWITGSITLAFSGLNLLDVEHIAVISLFVGVTFTLLGIAWKK